MTTQDAILNPQATFIDVRNEDELIQDGKLDKALHIPMHTVPDHVEEIKEMSKPIVVFCRAGGRAARIIEFLESQGVEELYNGGGLTDVQSILNQN